MALFSPCIEDRTLCFSVETGNERIDTRQQNLPGLDVDGTREMQKTVAIIGCAHLVRRPAVGGKRESRVSAGHGAIRSITTGAGGGGVSEIITSSP